MTLTELRYVVEVIEVLRKAVLACNLPQVEKLSP